MTSMRGGTRDNGRRCSLGSSNWVIFAEIMNAQLALPHINELQQARLAQSVARETLNLKVVGSSPTSGFLFLHSKWCR
jgi:hypothetical protein